MRVLHSVGCLSAGWEPMHINKLLLEVKPSDGSKMAVLASGFACCTMSVSSWPTCFRSPVQWREADGNPPDQEQSSLREVWFKAGSIEQVGEPSGGSVGIRYSVTRQSCCKVGLQEVFRTRASVCVATVFRMLSMNYHQIIEKEIFFSSKSSSFYLQPFLMLELNNRLLPYQNYKAKVLVNVGTLYPDTWTGRNAQTQQNQTGNQNDKHWPSCQPTFAMAVTSQQGTCQRVPSTPRRSKQQYWSGALPHSAVYLCVYLCLCV